MIRSVEALRPCDGNLSLSSVSENSSDHVIMDASGNG